MKQLSLKEYLVPASLDEALSTLGEYKGSVRVIAGGTDVFVEDHPGLDAMIDISKTGLSYIEKKPDELRIGSCTTYRELIKSGDVKKYLTSLWEASQVIADMTVRNIATVGGNICSAVPSGDAIPSMFAAGASFVLVSKGRERTVTTEEFFIGPRKTVIAENELLKEFVVPLAKGRCGSAFEKVARNSVDLANANVAVSLHCVDDGVVQDVRIAFGAVAPTVVRAKAAEAVLNGKKPNESLLDALCGKISDAISPITNIRSTKEYRTEVLSVLTKRAVMRAYEAAMA